jgi:cation diffusion facilitator family transporter
MRDTNNASLFITKGGYNMESIEHRNASEQKIITKVSIWTMILNFILASMKIIMGIIGRSSAIISDAVNSISDVVTALAVMIMGRFSRKEKDVDHQYGHEKYESMVSVFIGIALLLTAFEIGRTACENIYYYFAENRDIVPPTYIALIAGFATIAIKEGMYHYTKFNAKKAHSPSLEAMALDHRSDEFSALAAIIGIVGSMLEIHILEPIASIIICLFIVKLGLGIIKTGFSQVVDQAADQATIDKIKMIVANQAGIIQLDDLKTRIFGMRLFVDMEIAVDQKLSITEAHNIAHVLHDEIESSIPNVKHCMIHVNPYMTTDIDL